MSTQSSTSPDEPPSFWRAVQLLGASVYAGYGALVERGRRVAGEGERAPEAREHVPEEPSATWTEALDEVLRDTRFATREEIDQLGQQVEELADRVDRLAETIERHP